MPGSVETLKNRFVTVQLTLLSIAVALILENLLSMLLDLENWSPLIAIQALDVVVAAISMWVGFALGISTSNKPPHLLDFLVHFLLLFTLSTAVYCIASGYLPGYFFASALGSTSAAASLWLDHRSAQRHGFSGPVITATLLTLVALLEASLGLLAALTTLDSIWFVALILPVVVMQAYAAFRSMRFWQQALDTKAY